MVETKEVKKKKVGPKIDIYKAWCKACGICVAFCPTGALDRDETGSPYVKDVEKCISCGWCEIRCPDFAITVEQKVQGRSKPRRKVKRKSQSQTQSGKRPCYRGMRRL